MTASTGVGAVNVGGQTFHSFFGIGGPLYKDHAKSNYQRKKLRVGALLEQLNTLIIDEVSMLHGWLVDACEGL